MSESGWKRGVIYAELSLWGQQIQPGASARGSCWLYGVSLARKEGACPQRAHSARPTGSELGGKEGEQKRWLCGQTSQPADRAFVG